MFLTGNNYLPKRFKVLQKSYIFSKINFIMAINPICDKCKKELNEFGGILLSPPNKNNEVTKFHLCISCYEELIDSFNSRHLKTSSKEIRNNIFSPTQ